MGSISYERKKDLNHVAHSCVIYIVGGDGGCHTASLVGPGWWEVVTAAFSALELTTCIGVMLPVCVIAANKFCINSMEYFAVRDDKQTPFLYSLIACVCLGKGSSSTVD